MGDSDSCDTGRFSMQWRAVLMPPVLYTSLVVAIVCLIAGVMEHSGLLIRCGLVVAGVAVGSMMFYRRWDDE
jgi:hypothetical protein